MPAPTCPQGCTATLPEVSFDRCNPETSLSEIRRIFVAALNAKPFTDISTAAEWTTRLSQTATTTGDEIRALTVIADKPAPTLTEKDISGGRKIIINKAHVINWTIDEANEINHEFIRQLECGGQFRIWYETYGGRIYGGDEGIVARLKGDMVLARGDENVVYNGTAEWKSRYTEEYVASPIAISYN